MFHIIDDDLHLHGLTVELLESAGFEAQSFADPVEYLHLVNSEDYTPPKALFTDIRMPQMSGYELIDRVREKYPRQKFIVLSGYDGDGVETLRKKVCHFLQKPFMPEQLISIATALDRCDIGVGELLTMDVCGGLKMRSGDKAVCPLDCGECGKLSNSS